MKLNLIAFFILIHSLQAFGQTDPLAPAKKVDPPSMGSTTSTPVVTSSEEEGEKPNGRRIRRQLNLILGVEHDEEILIPERDISIKGLGSSENFEIKRIRGTDYFRIMPKKPSSGIATINDKKTGQILVELRYDIRDGIIEKQMREMQLLLADIEGLESHAFEVQRKERRKRAEVGEVEKVEAGEPAIRQRINWGQTPIIEIK